jgi:hypothetical protein
MKTQNRRLQVPMTMAIVGSAIAVASLVSKGWGAALGVEVFTVAATLGFYALGRRDSDLGAASGGRSDERQASIQGQAAALSGIAMTIAALVGFIVTTALGVAHGSLRSLWASVACSCSWGR